MRLQVSLDDQLELGLAGIVGREGGYLLEHSGFESRVNLDFNFDGFSWRNTDRFMLWLTALTAAGQFVDNQSTRALIREFERHIEFPLKGDDAQIHLPGWKKDCGLAVRAASDWPQGENCSSCQHGYDADGCEFDETPHGPRSKCESWSSYWTSVALHSPLDGCDSSEASAWIPPLPLSTNSPPTMDP